MNKENALLEEQLNQDEIHQETETAEVASAEGIAEVASAEETTEVAPAEETTEVAPAEENAEAAPAEETTEEKAAQIIVPYHERYYLRYHGGKRSIPMDLEGTRAFLQDIGFDGGELKQAREGKYTAGVLRLFEKPRNNQMYCSYCGSEISGIEFYRMPDGRLRCTTCSGSLVKTKEEVQEICNRVIANMENFFGATIDVSVSIDVLDERKLKKKIGVPIGTRDSQSMLILGVAINNKKKKTYSILLENGAPRISLMATFAHELTHIWQYTHWDNNPSMKKCPNSKRLLIYEGMAKWAEIQYLYLIGETNVARREELITRERKDAYGIGFCIYEDHYPLSRDAMNCDDTPFTPGRYPFD